ncbi:MAG: cytochrome C, partial [Vicinamibacterales bacterium]
YVKLTDRRTGQVREFVIDGTSPDALTTGERRRMDCVDCHNRPTHVFDSTAERALNRALGAESIPRDLPFVRREGARLLKAGYASRSAALTGIKQGLETFYRENFPAVSQGRTADIGRAVIGLQQLYSRNVFPTMGVTWGVHANNRGHVDSPGCFRCHDGEHKTSAGDVISQECDLCHELQ